MLTWGLNRKGGCPTLGGRHCIIIDVEIIGLGLNVRNGRF
jgi:hypothetical protein